MGPSGKLRDKKAHGRSFQLKARVKRLKAAAKYKKERQILAQTAMIHYMTAPKLAKAPGWALRYITYKRVTERWYPDYSDYWQQEKRLDDDPEEIYVATSAREGGSSDDSPHSGESDRDDHLVVNVPDPGCIFASYETCDYCHETILIREKKDFRRHTRNLLGIGPPTVDNSDRGVRPRWLSCLHPQKRAEAHAEVKNLIESWDGEEFEFRRYDKTFATETKTPANHNQCREVIAITVRPIWIERRQPEPFFKEHSVRTTHNETHVL